MAVRAVAQLTLVATVGLAAMPAHAEDERTTVLSIGDGDTLRLRSSAGVITVRLACIDAPEGSQGPWGAAARRELQVLLPIGQPVELRAQATDRYGRIVAEVFRGGRNINQALVGSGAAFVYWQYIAGCDRNAYSRLEAEARLRRLGVWSSSGGITRPWTYRRMGRSGVAQQIGSYVRAQQLRQQGHSYLDGDGDGEACERLPRARIPGHPTGSTSVLGLAMTPPI